MEQRLSVRGSLLQDAWVLTVCLPLLAGDPSRIPPAHTSAVAVPAHAVAPPGIPAPLPGHPGNVFLEGEEVQVAVREAVPVRTVRWRLLDDRQRVVREDQLELESPTPRPPLSLGRLGLGWYRLEFGEPNQTQPSWTSLAVLKPLRQPTSPDSPIAVDSAAAWFAPDDSVGQQRLAQLAALAGVSWVRDRLRWRAIQPEPGQLAPPPTTYDTSADAHGNAGLRLLQVFHDTPPWAREDADAGGRFAPDLRHLYELARALALRFRGRVQAWEPWNEANIAVFGGHTVDQMCAWQKAAWLGFKSGDPDLVVGWNVTAGVPTPAHTAGVLANETWPYYDTYNIHTYDWPHAYADLWQPAREAAAGRPIWITEADRGTPHLQNPPWYDQDPRLERLKAEWIAQSYAQSLFAGARRHFHFILGNYQERNHIQFGLLRHDLSPRPGYVALAAVGRCLADARVLGRWQPGQHVQVYAFRAQPDGQERDVLVVWAERDVDWPERGTATAAWQPPADLDLLEVVDYLGRSRGRQFPAPLTSAPVFVFLPPGAAARLPLESPPVLAPWREGQPSPVVLQVSLARSALRKVEDLPWSEGYAYKAQAGEPLDLKLHAYNFATNSVTARVRVTRQPRGWETTLAASEVSLAPMERREMAGTVRIPLGTAVRDGWVVLHADCGRHGRPALALRVVASDR